MKFSLSLVASVAAILSVSPSSVTAFTVPPLQQQQTQSSSGNVLKSPFVGGDISTIQSASTTALPMGLRSFIKTKILRRGRKEEAATARADLPKPKLISKPKAAPKKAAPPAPAPAKEEVEAVVDVSRPSVGTKVKVVSEEPIVLNYVYDGALNIVGLTGTVVRSKPIIVEFTEPTNFKAYLAVSQVEAES
mmetsp:Transcript_4174/g.6327  ORF Transcript_4174/g.6327 Transcript_4174/m.6327 type:complete len:191 (-) Transcript_4174:176-748(-)